MINVYKVTRGEVLLFESVQKDAAIQFAQTYYSHHKVICTIDEFKCSPKNHT